MANKNTLSSFAQLAAIAPKSDVVIETAPSVKESVQQFDEFAFFKDPIAPVEDEREHEDQGGLNDVEEEPEAPPADTLNTRDVRTWTEAELESYIAGEVDVDVYHSTVVAAINEMRIRNTTLPAAWSVDECKTFYINGLKPEQTTKGAWVKDVTRASRREHEWTNQELESWALGEIKPEGQTIASGLAIELKSRLNLVVPTVDVDAVIQCYKVKEGLVKAPATMPTKPTPKVAVAKATVAVVQPSKITINHEGLSMLNQSYIESALTEFHAVMKPGRAVTNKAGGEAQKLLKELITYAYSQPDPVVANAALKVLFDHFAANRADGLIFEDTYAFRFIEDMVCPPKDQIEHAALLSLFLAYADPMIELRSQTDVGSLIKGVPTRFQSRMFEFFSKV